MTDAERRIKMRAQEQLAAAYEFVRLGNGPSATGSPTGWNMSPALYLKCVLCGYMMSLDPEVYDDCFCRALSKDADAGRVGSSLGDSAIEVYRAEPRTAAGANGCGAELLALYEMDRRDHAAALKANTPEYRAMRQRDRERRRRVIEIASAGELVTSDDCYRAAWIMNHGDTPEDAYRAHLLALRASELGCTSARWLAAASYDRWRMYQGKPQKYGTNYVNDGYRERLWDVDPETTDEERAAWNVPPLAVQLAKAEEANRQQAPMTDRERQEFLANAPQWLKSALARRQHDEKPA